MRISPVLLGLQFAALVGAAALSTPPAQPSADPTARRATVTVTIVFQCEGTRSVSPWRVRLQQGDEIEWVLDPSSDVPSFEIRKKRALQRWPFGSPHPPRGRPGEPARGTGMRPATSGTYPYDIVAPCPGPGNSTRNAVIDPDIIIDF